MKIDLFIFFKKLHKDNYKYFVTRTCPISLLKNRSNKSNYIKNLIEKLEFNEEQDLLHINLWTLQKFSLYLIQDFFIFFNDKIIKTDIIESFKCFVRNIIIIARILSDINDKLTEIIDDDSISLSSPVNIRL